MGNPDWLTQLSPAHPPPQAGWWPLAPGWWGLIVLLLIIVAALLYRQRRPMLRLRRAALRELKILEASLSDDISLARDLEHLLRRYAVARFGRDEVAMLAGESWGAFIVARVGNTWPENSVQALLRIAYGGRAEIDRTHWLTGARAFIRGCK